MFREPNFSFHPQKKDAPSKGNELSEMQRAYDSLKMAKGKAGADLLGAEISKGRSGAEVLRKSEDMVSLEETKKVAFDKLEELGFLFRTQEGQLVCDIEKMKNELNFRVFKKLGQIYGSKHLGESAVSKTTMLLFEDLQVISKKDWENGIREEKNLLYSPKNKEDALDLKKIKSSRFYLTMRDLNRVPEYKKIGYGSIPKEDLDFREVLLPVLIYHPEYGNGYRDEKDGRLYVIDKETKKPRRLTSEYIQKTWGVFGPPEVGENFSYPKLFVKKHLPHLVEKGLLMPEDFTVRIDKRNRQVTDRVVTKIKPKGQVWFDGMEHFIGMEYVKNKNKAYQLSKNLGGVVDENENLLATFNLFKKDRRFSKTPEGSKLFYYRVKKTETQPREFHKEDFFDQKPNESRDEYKKRIKEIADFRDVLDVSDKVLVRENINLVDLSFKEQLLIATLFKRIGEKRFLEFIEEYQLDGLRVCVALEGEENMEKILLRIAEQKKKDGKFSARLIFRKYNGIVREKENLQEIINQMVPTRDFSQTDYANITTNFEKKTQRILEDFSVDIDKSSVDKVENKLEKIQKEIIFLGLVLTLFRERKGEFSIEDILGVEMETVGEKELMENPTLAEKLKEMYRSSIEHKSQEDQARLLSDFETHKQHNPRFHLVYFDKENKNDPKKSLDNLVGFMRSSSFDGQKELPEGERYLGAMNIDPILQKFYFGENFLREIVEKELASGTKKLIAHVPENGPSHKIVKLLGFETVAEDGDYRDDAGNITAKRLRVELVKN